MYNKRLIATIICIAMVITNVIPHFALNDEIIDNLINETTKTYIDVNESDEESSTVETEIDDYVLELDNEEVVESIDETVTEDELDDELVQNETEELEESVEVEVQETNQIEEEISTIIDIVEDIENISTVSEIILEEIVEEQLVPEEVSEEKIASKSEIENDVVPVYPMGNIHQDFEVPYIKQNDSKLFGASNDENLPSRFDSRNESNGSVSIIPPVRNQNPYGTCWSFSAMGIMETDLRKKGIFTTDDDESKLSEAALAYFAYNLKNVTADGSKDIDKPGIEGNDYTIINDWKYLEEYKATRSFADVGGNLYAATNLLSNRIGAVKVNDDTKYDKVANIIKNGLDGKYAFNSNSFEIENAYYISKNDKNLIKKAIMDHGAVGFSYYAISERHDAENRKYYHEFNNSNYSNKQWSFFTPADITTTNHAIMIVGWDDNIPASNFYCDTDGTSATNDGAWLCRNSWGEDWEYSDGGYFWISYDETSLSNVFVAVDAVKAGKYEYNYHYDTATFMAPAGFNDSNFKFGHVYQVSDDENQLLEAINIGILSENNLFDIEIYTSDKKMNNCADGELVLNQEVSKDIGGFYTIELNKKIVLKKGNYYSIVIKPKNQIHILVSTSTDPVNGPFDFTDDYNEVEKGQAFEAVQNGSKYVWKDLADYEDKTFAYNGKLWGWSFMIRGFANKARVITFDANGGVGTMEDQYIRYASESYINKNQFTKDDCIFIGWEDDDHNLYADGERITLYNDLNLRASWSEVSKIVALENPTKTVYNYGETIDLSGLKIRLIYTNGETTDVVYNNDTKNDFSILNNFMSASNKVKDASIIRVKYKSKDIEFDKIDGVRDYLGTVAVNGLGYPITINNTPNFTEPITIYKTGNVLPVTVLTTYEWDMNETYEYNFLNNKFPLILYDTNKNAEWSGVPNYDSAIMMYFYGMGDNNNMKFYDTVKDVIIPEGKIDGTNIFDGLSTTIRSDKPMSFYFRNNYVVIILSRQNDKMYFYPHFSGLLNSIVIKDKPNKLNYLAGEKFDPTGLAITANNVDKNNNTNSRDFVYDERYKDEFTFSPSLDEALTPDVEKITVSFRGFSCDLPIAVAENTGEMVTVTFDYDDDGKIATVSIPKGSKVMAPNVPTKKGYTFKLWEKRIAPGTFEVFDFNTPIMEDITLEVLWSAKRYTVRYYQNDEDRNGMVGWTVPYKMYYPMPFTRASLSETLDITGDNPGRISIIEGLVVTAWYCPELDEDVTSITPDDSISYYRLYGRWRKAKYNIAFDLDGVGANPINSIEKEYNENNLTLPTPENIPSGYEFLGWYYNDTKYDGKTELLDDTDPYVSVDGTTITLKAKWKRAIVFNENGRGTAPNSIEITGATNITLPNITATGYTFGGWYRSATDFSNANRVGGAGESVLVSEQTTFYAKWTATTYTINYNANGGNVNPTSLSKTYDTAFTGNLAEPTKTGYTFAGWFIDNNTFNNAYDKTKDDIYVEGTTIYTIYAKWTAKTYTVNYNANGGNITGQTSFEKTFGTPYTGTLANPTKTGYTFAGWYSDNNTFEKPYDKTKDDIYQEGTLSYSIYAKWNPKTYTINYNANGGTVTPTSFIKTYDTAYAGDLARPTKAGYTFIGWYRDNTTFNSEYNKNNDDIYIEGTTAYTIYAKWTENTYSITFELDGGSWDSFDPTSMSSRKYSEAVTFPDGTKVKKTGYTFAGWYNKAETSQRILTGISANTVGDFVFVAKWNEKSYSITLNSRGGTFKNGYTSLLKRNFTERKDLPTENDIEYVGHRFDGWYEQSDSSATNRIYYVSENTDAEKTFYAKWSKQTYSVTLNTNGGIVNSGNITNYTYGDTVNLPTDVTRAGYVFKGWWTSDGTTAGVWGTQVTTIGNTSTGNKTYYAKWAASYEVTFNLTTGVAPAESTITNKPATQNIESGGMAVRPTIVPTAPNFSFIEWYTDDTFTIPFNFRIAISRATTIYAKWENVTNHNVTFNLTSGTIHPNDASISGKPDTTYVIHNRQANKPGNPSAEGYKFVNWYTDNTFTTVWDFNTNVVTADDTVIYGKWEYQTYTVVYNMNGGAWANGFTPTTKRQYNSSITLPDSSNINKYAYVFNGWYEDKELSYIAISSILADTAKNIILYAKWTLDSDAKIITFAFDSSNNAAIVEQAFFLNEDTVLSSNIFTKKGYTFIGWKDLNGNTYTNTKELTGDIRLIAQWQQDKIPNTPIYDGGSTYTGGGGSGGGGGGGGGGGIAPNNAQTNLAPTTTEIPTIKIDMPPIDATLTKWVYDPISNKYKLNINLNGQEISAVNGFYTLNSIETKIVNNLPVPMITQNTYYFNALGDMITGWVKTVDNKYYFFEHAKTVDEGKMVVGWKQIQNEWYYFNQDGSMFVNGITPDGYGIAADGKMIR